MKVLVVSPGGVGCTYIIEFINKIGIQTNDRSDIDDFKHISYPTNDLDKLSKFDKLIYVAGHPELAIRSHFRRKWEKQQASKLGKNLEFDEINDFITYAETNQLDPFGIVEHFYNWFNNRKNVPIPIIFTYLEEIEQNPKNICNFLNIDINQLNEFKIEERHSRASCKFYEEKWKEMKDKIDQEFD